MKNKCFSYPPRLTLFLKIKQDKRTGIAAAITLIFSEKIADNKLFIELIYISKWHKSQIIYNFPVKQQFYNSCVLRIKESIKMKINTQLILTYLLNPK